MQKGCIPHVHLLVEAHYQDNRISIVQESSLYSPATDATLSICREWKGGGFSRAVWFSIELPASGQPPEPTPPVSLAVPLLEAPLQTRGSQPGTNVQMPIAEPYEGMNINVSAYDTQSPQNPAAPSTPFSMPEPSIPAVVAVPPLPTTPGQTFDILLTPIVPESQVRRYGRHVPVYANYTMWSELPF
ncbi:hypothetical protein F4604DRAFT_1821488 [Suillus subluteus]|nr:hypothetical protein F4604DRAFT_1821488 [Suillus subluteus]